MKNMLVGRAGSEDGLNYVIINFADTTKIQLKQIAYTLSFYSLVLSPFIFACLEYIHFRRHISALLTPNTI